jgi:enoyl-CoA hydratase/carnithine racemase
MTQVYRTLRVAPGDKGVLGVVIDAPPMNLIGPGLVHDLVGLLGALESDQETRVIVLESADPDYFVPHVDLTKVAEYTAEAARAGVPDDASLGMLWHKLSELPVVTISKLRGRARGAGSELALACDMRFAARENTILGQIEVGAGALPGAGGMQHLARLLGRGRAMEAVLGADDFSADEAERYGWINRALPDAELGAFVARLARRIASFPAEGVRTAKQVLNGLTLPGADAIVGTGGAAVPIQLGEPLASWVLDPDLDKYRRMDSRMIVGAALDMIAGGIPGDIREDYLACYDGGRFAESIRYVRAYPQELPVLAGLLPQITVPVTIINGRHDRVIPLHKAEFPRPAAACQPPRDHRCRALRLGGGAEGVRLHRPRLDHGQLAMTQRKPGAPRRRFSHQARSSTPQGRGW